LQPGQENPALPAHDVLNQLLERLDLPSELRPRMDALRNRLQQGLQPADLPPVLNELVDLVGQVRSHAEQERQEVERFLLQLTEQLTNLDREIEGVGQQGIDILAGSRRFGEAVDADVSDMHASVASATDLDELKQVIALRLQEIQERLREHREDEQNKNRKLEQSISLLQGRIREMEQESSTLRNEVAAARVEAFTDALTRLNNRLAYNSRMDHEYRRWKRYPFEMSLILLDVDHFKRVNDNFGHHAGDKVLKVFGSLLNHMTRETDFAARYGGEEFIVLLPETDLAGARAVAEKIRQSIESKAFHSGDQRVRITASCGVARFHEGDTPESVFKRCDDALYLAKNQGRNRCCTEDEL
jgi:diguanylate cyclase